jgi:hypothetical protein
LRLRVHCWSDFTMKADYFAFSIGLLLACAAPAAPAWAAEPAAGFTIEADYTAKSPDGTTTIEQYHRDDPAEGFTWQFWVRRSDTMTLLEKEPSDYPADFLFTTNSSWLARLQKTGSGEGSLFLYKLGPQGFVAATSKPLGDLAWEYFYKQPASRKVMKPDFHINAGLVKGMDENYRWLGVSWPDSRYILISLSGEVEPNGKHHQLRTVNSWSCRYDLQEGKFDVPEVLLKHNAQALVPQ